MLHEPLDSMDGVAANGRQVGSLPAAPAFLAAETALYRGPAASADVVALGPAISRVDLLPDREGSGVHVAVPGGGVARSLGRARRPAGSGWAVRAPTAGKHAYQAQRDEPGQEARHRPHAAILCRES